MLEKEEKSVWPDDDGKCLKSPYVFSRRAFLCRYLTWLLLSLVAALPNTSWRYTGWMGFGVSNLEFVFMQLLLCWWWSSFGLACTSELRKVDEHGFFNPTDQLWKDAHMLFLKECMNQCHGSEHWDLSSSKHRLLFWLFACCLDLYY